MDNNINNNIPTESSETNHVAALEAILFLHGEPVSRVMLGRLLQLSEQQVLEVISSLKEELQRTGRGLMLMEKGGEYMLITKPQFSIFLESFVKDSLREDLTPSAVETLSLVAYFGPITRAQIDYIRGVNSSFMLRNLLVRGLIERTSKGNAYVYEVTAQFLAHMGLSHISDLPQYIHYQETRKNFFETGEPSIISTNSENQTSLQTNGASVASESLENS